MAVDGTIGIPPDAVGGKTIDTSEVVTNVGTTAERQRINVSDPTNVYANGLQDVKNSRAAVADNQVAHLLEEILEQMKFVVELLSSAVR